MSSSRAGYVKATPSTPHFPISLEPLASSADDVGDEDDIQSWTPHSGTNHRSKLDWTNLLERWRTFHPPRRISHCIDVVREFVEDNAGLLLVALSQLFFALMNVMVKKLNALDPPVPPLELVSVRMGITYVCCITYMTTRGIEHPFIGPGPYTVRILLILRGLSGFIGLFGTYFSLQYLSLADTTVLSFLSPFTTAVAAHFILSEKMRLKEVWAALVSLFGVLLIARPTFLFHSSSSTNAAPEEPATLDPVAGVGDERGTPADRLHAVGFMMLGVVGTTVAFLSIRAVGKRAHALHSLTSFSLQSVIASSIGMLATGTHVVVPTSPAFLLFLLLIGVSGFVAQFLLTLGVQRENVGRASMGTYAQLIFASAFDRIFFHGKPSFLSVLGTVIIMGAAFYVAVTKEKDPANNTSSTASGHRSRTTAQSAVPTELEEGLLHNAAASDGEDDEEDGKSVDNAPERDSMIRKDRSLEIQGIVKGDNA
ncbi:DUF6-domain-containing protein [Punctularia strigosozonata HHB-11173 SS5]|uniref:DUF6-domain-containing protein n=1 Tax=Punctularia strigosozonata (strain HHB-11173) TaxID=741275 RepID=UPI0004417B81|nr:DUF6-domain-containing protein [Punctularia strigosozonata HHB-11173 SS5]EIN06921.1 DUF6-domain-containing protein [Punctularia strigosozonata HHB-11173 SS5]